MLICVTRNFDISNVGESNMSVQGRIYLNLINLNIKAIHLRYIFTYNLQMLDFMSIDFTGKLVQLSVWQFWNIQIKMWIL